MERRTAWLQECVENLGLENVLVKRGRAEEYDGQTFETWKQANALSPGGKMLLDLGIESVWAAPMSRSTPARSCRFSGM